jgi:methylenetetrahydrofolate reductase (NADPH)
VREIKDSGADFCIGGACYPEIHPESANQAEDIKHLREKVDAGCDFLTTQMFFDNNLLYNFLYKIREAGITVPVIPGIMPITNANQLERAVKLSGSFIPQKFLNLVDKFGAHPDTMMQAGIAYATEQIIDLYANGIKNVHVYSMNKPEVAKAIQSNVSEIIK